MTRKKEKDPKSRLNSSGSTPEMKDSKGAKKKGKHKHRRRDGAPEKPRNAKSMVRPSRLRYTVNDVFYGEARADGERPAAYKIVMPLGSGGCGDVYLVEREGREGVERYALKVEPIVDERKSNASVEQETIDVEPSPVKKPVCGVLLEMEILTELAKLEADKQKHFIHLVDKGEDRVNKMRFMVMTLVGPSLEKIRQKHLGRDFRPHTAAGIAFQVLEGIRHLHACGFIHQDLKPANLATGCNDFSIVIILDFGIARRFRDENGNWKAGKTSKFVGTLQFATRACHRLEFQGPKDDLETWIFVLIDLHRHKFAQTHGLPWYSLTDRDRILEMKTKACEDFDGYMAALQRKRRTSRAKDDKPKRSVVKAEPPLPSVNPMLKHLDSLRVSDTPDYDFLRKSLEGTYSALNINWTLPPEYINLPEIEMRRRNYFGQPVEAPKKKAVDPTREPTAEEPADKSEYKRDVESKAAASPTLEQEETKSPHKERKKKTPRADKAHTPETPEKRRSKNEKPKRKRKEAPPPSSMAL